MSRAEEAGGSSQNPEWQQPRRSAADETAGNAAPQLASAPASREKLWGSAHVPEHSAPRVSAGQEAEQSIRCVCVCVRAQMTGLVH